MRRRFFTMLFIMTAAGASASTLPLGTFVPTSATDQSCPDGFACSGFEVSCPGVTQDAPGFLAFAEATAPPRGMLVFFTGGSGEDWWSSENRDLPAFVDEMRSLGFAIAQVRWATNWLISSAGNEAGTAHLGCRPATVIQHVHETKYRPMTLSPRRSECGFCITGNSGGSTQVSYALTHYGLETILDGVFPTGGPPHAAMAKSCLGEEGYGYPIETRNFLDRGFGFFDGNGPCARQDPSFIPRWNEESVATGGSDYYHPDTRIHFIFGEKDRPMQIVGGDYVARLRSAGSPLVTSVIAANTSHGVFRTPQGRAALKDAILGSPSPPPVRRRPARP